MCLGEMKKYVPSPHSSLAASEATCMRWTMVGDKRTLGSTMGNAEQPGLQQESLKET